MKSFSGAVDEAHLGHRRRTWGFRFLRKEGPGDPLPLYEAVFSGTENEPKVWRQVGEKGALRFPDPEERKDVVGRVIPHDFVVFPPLAGEINSVEDGQRRVWPLVKDEFAQVWELPKPPFADG